MLAIVLMPLMALFSDAKEFCDPQRCPWRCPIRKETRHQVNGLERATGLTAQVQAFRRRAGFYRSQPDVDALVSAGANDVLDFIDEGLIDAALETRTRRDDRRLVRSAVQSISGNLIGNIDRLTGVVDEVAVLGALPLTSTPLVVSKSEQLNSRSAKTLKAMVNGVSRRVMRMLAREYRRQNSVAIIDAQPLWSKIANPGFIDPVHPSSQASGELAQLIVSKVSDRLPGFGFG